MFVISVNIIGRGIFKETLSYFSLQKNLSLGSVVSVPVRQKLQTGIITGLEEAVKHKASLKRADFSLRKLEGLKSHPFFLPAFMEAIKESAEYFAGNTGGTLASFVSSVVLSSREALVRPPTLKKPLQPGQVEKHTFQAEDEERLAAYKALIRESFARGKSVFLCFPSIPETEHFFEPLQRGIEEHSFLLHSLLSKKKLLASWLLAINKKHPVLVMGTGTFLSLPREDFGLYIIEKESSRFYKSSVRPYADARVLAEKLAEKCGALLVLGDSLLRVETLYRLEEGELTEFSAMRWRPLAENVSEVVYLGGENKKKAFSALSPELIALLLSTSKEQELLFIFANRRGLSPLTLCQDCGAVVACRTCNAPTTLHRGPRENIFFCHRCGEKRSAAERCRYCDSWRLTSLGVGLDMIEDEIKKIAPEIPVFRLDKDSVKNHKEALAVTSKFYRTRGSVLLGTEMALYYLHEKIENIAAAAFDGLFAIPDFRMSERVFSILLSLRSLAKKRFLIQTRNHENSAVTEAAKGDIAAFYKEELGLRRVFNYPPWSRLVRISVEGKKENVSKQIAWLKENLKDLEPLVFPALTEKKGGGRVMQALLSFPRKEWPKKEIVERLRALPPIFKVEVDPEHTL